MGRNDQLFREIAKELGVPLWLDLTDQEQTRIMKDDRESAPTDYFECKHDALRETLDVIHFDPYDAYPFPKLYSLDLNTMKPTHDCSMATVILSSDLCGRIRVAYPVVKHFYAEKTTDIETVVQALKNGYTVSMRQK